MKDFIEIQNNTLDEIVYNSMLLFRHNDLGAKIDTSLNREIKKENETPTTDAPLQLRLRLHNRFNMDLNNVYAMEMIPQDGDLTIETSVNVYHDDFNLDDFKSLVIDVFNDVLKGVDTEFLLKRFEFNFRNAVLHWKAAKEKQFIIDPQVDRLKEMYDLFVQYSALAQEQAGESTSEKISDYLVFTPDIILEKRKLTYAKSKILKVEHKCPAGKYENLMTRPQFFSLLLLEYCLVPLFLANELYVMSLIYKRDLGDIRTVLHKRILET